MKNIFKYFCVSLIFITGFNFNASSQNMFVEKSNVLGAGDMFASSFLYALNNNMSIEQIQKYAHETTSRLITSANEKV